MLAGRLCSLAPNSLTSEISKISDKICKTRCSFEGVKVYAILQASRACTTSRAHCPVLQRPGPVSPWFSLALVARWEQAEPGKVALALGSILSGSWGLSPQVIKEASSLAASGVEAPTSPVMPCKMDLDKVMVSNHLAKVLHGAAAAEPGEHSAGSSFPSSQQLCGAYGAPCHWGRGAGLPWHRGMSQPCTGGTKGQ